MPALCPSQLIGLAIRRAPASVEAPAERYCHVWAAAATVLLHVTALGWLLLDGTREATVVMEADVPRMRLALLPRAPEVPPSDHLAPVPSEAAALAPTPVIRRPEPPATLREQARIHLPPPAPPQPVALILDAPVAEQAARSAAPPAPTLPPGPVEASPSHDSWEGRVMARLERYRRYPSAARSHRQQGVAWVNATLDRDGQLLALRLQQSSGHPLLDEAAIATFHRAAPLPRVPADRGVPLQLQFPVEFALR